MKRQIKMTNNTTVYGVDKPKDIADPSKWIIKIGALLDKLKYSKSAYDLTTQDLPYVYQSEYYNNAWGLKYYGFLISPNGKVYTYSKPKKWNQAHTDELTPYELIQNFYYSNLRSTFYRKRKSFELTQSMIDDLLKSPIEGQYQVCCDRGKRTNVLWLYDNELKRYKKILLSVGGDDELINNSVYAKSLIKELGEV